MSIEQSILETLHSLPAAARQEVLDFAAFLQQKTAPTKTPRRSLLGLWTGIDIDGDAIDQARQEMWNKFPREIEP